MDWFGLGKVHVWAYLFTCLSGLLSMKMAWDEPLLAKSPSFVTTNMAGYIQTSCQTQRRIAIRSCLKSLVLSPQTWLEMSVCGDKLCLIVALNKSCLKVSFKKPGSVVAYAARHDLTFCQKYWFFCCLKHCWKLSRGLNENNWLCNHKHGWSCSDVPSNIPFFITIDGMSHLQMLKHAQCKSNTITSTSRYESLVMECKCDINCFVEMSIWCIAYDTYKCESISGLQKH